MIAALFSLLLPASCSLARAVVEGRVTLSPRVGWATSFGPSDVDAGNPVDVLACEYPRRLGADDWAVASYSLPCGSWLIICSLADPVRCAVARVRDRGPVRTRRNPALQATDLDLSYPLSRVLGLRGSGAVLWSPIEVTNGR